jgi:hypothetical protein
VQLFIGMNGGASFTSLSRLGTNSGDHSKTRHCTSSAPFNGSLFNWDPNRISDTSKTVITFAVNSIPFVRIEFYYNDPNFSNAICEE